MQRLTLSALSLIGCTALLTPVLLADSPAPESPQEQPTIGPGAPSRPGATSKPTIGPAQQQPTFGHAPTFTASRSAPSTPHKPTIDDQKPTLSGAPNQPSISGQPQSPSIGPAGQKPSAGQATQKSPGAGARDEADSEDPHRRVVWQGPGDADGNGTVDITDFLMVLNSLGSRCQFYRCPTDLNGDGMTDILDMLEVMENWQ